ncbi:hypothetical protein JK636_22175 [Clostridium sp. YIM B02515]|uniref:DUF7852 domain-containing protein n=1 Tax=Clostridium rhizosphaerae TaxID=2803861 RepID=A0ABS1TKD0_9CLOT|nr:hypothetical protein [Clostridium rhizosphaerae]MBL4938423.1 hypothetical protein [Clostridium rhizosphaerae]
MGRYYEKNPGFDPNMLIILLLILSVYSQRPMYYFDNELLNIKHKKASNDDVNKENDIGYTGGVLSEEKDLANEADSNIANDNLSYTGGVLGGNNESQDESNFGVVDDSESYTGGTSSEDRNATYEAYSSISGGSGEINNNSSADLDFKDNADCSDIISTEVIPEYPNKLIIPDIDCNEIVAQVPVVLSQFEIEFSCETTIKLDSPAIDIKRTKKNIFLDECRLLPKVNKLFLSGVVRKNIEYGAKDNIKHITVEVPFKCTTEVEYFTLPVIRHTDEEIEIETLRLDGAGTDLAENTRLSSEQFNEKIYCKLVSDEVKELEIADEDKDENENPECERLFETITEKMVVKLNLKLIQEQEINIKRNI